MLKDRESTNVRIMKHKLSSSDSNNTMIAGFVMYMWNFEQALIMQRLRNQKKKRLLITSKSSI